MNSHNVDVVEDIFQNSAKEIGGKVQWKTTSFDPMTIMTIISLIKGLIDLYIQCKKNDWHLFSDAKAMKAGSIMTYFKRRRLRNEVKKISNNPEEQAEIYAKFLDFAVENKDKVTKMFVAKGALIEG